MTELKRSGVVFDEERHTYTLGGKKLSGVTGMIHKVLGLGTYPDASERVKREFIPLAGRYGKRVHKSIEAYDKTGEKNVEYAPEVITNDYGDKLNCPAHDVTDELNAYIGFKNSRGARTLANEFTVSDEAKFASQVDVVWEINGKVWLVDTKTNNVQAYPGGEPALREYLSWQLSVYAHLFERQTGVEVSGLLGFWAHRYTGKGVESALWDIARVDDDKVAALLDRISVIVTDNGFIYEYDGDASELLARKPVEVNNDLVPQEVVDAIASYLIAEREAKALKEKLREAMEAHGIQRWENDRFTATIGKASSRQGFDEKRFAADHAELHKSYLVNREVKGSFKITLKK